jgi:hypothetical protein
MSELQNFSVLSYFDNLALYYLSNETPPSTLALAFLHGDTKVTGSILGLLDAKRREYIHKLMSEQENESDENKQSAVTGMLIIAENLLTRNLIEKRGQFYYGVKKE